MHGVVSVDTLLLLVGSSNVCAVFIHIYIPSCTPTQAHWVLHVGRKRVLKSC